MTPAQARALLDETGAPIMGSPLGALLTAQAVLEPDRPALTIGGKTVSRAELETMANRRARQFAAMGGGHNDTVLIAIPNCLDFYVCTLAIWKLGAIPAPVSHHLTSSEFAALVDLAQPALVIGGPQDFDFDKGKQIDTGVPLDPELSAEPLPPITARSWKMSATGGSTGQPRLIVDANPGQWVPDMASFRRAPGSTVLNAAPLHHSAPFGLILPCLLQGCHVIDMGRFEAQQWLDLVERNRVSWAYMVPTMMTRIARLPPDLRQHDLSCLKTLIHVAAPCPEWTKRFWIERIGADAVWEIYGGTERLGSTLIGGEEWLAHPGSVGKPGAGIEVEIRDAEGHALAAGDVGEIFFRRANGAATSMRTGDGEIPQGGDWASFGDLGWLDEDGYLYIADRRTDLIVCGGANLYPAEIEMALETCPEVLEAVVIGLPDPDLGQKVHAVVNIGDTDPGSICEQDVLRHLGSRLAKTKLPRSIEFTTRRIRDDAGKVRRSAWREEILARRERQSPG